VFRDPQTVSDKFLQKIFFAEIGWKFTISAFDMPKDRLILFGLVICWWLITEEWADNGSTYEDGISPQPYCL